MASSTTSGSADGRLPEDARAAFLEACRDESRARAYLAGPIRELADQVAILRQRAHALEASQRLELPPEPGPVHLPVVREADFHEWDRAEPAEVLSLDVFDTCLVRDVERPRDIFVLAGSRVKALTGMDAEAFALARHEVEQALRREWLARGQAEDVNLPAIHAALAGSCGWDMEAGRQVMEAELAMERLFLRPVEAVRERAWQAFRAGVRLVYTSEMYLAGAVVRELLEAAGFPVEGAAVYTSGESGLSKGTGNLYRRVSAERPGTLLHVGDNPETDGRGARQAGLASAVIRTGHRVMPDLFSNAMEAVLRTAERPSGGNFWEELGFRLAGPLHLAFAAFLRRASAERGGERVYFLSRDGWLPVRVFRRLDQAWGSVAESRYLYASREYLGLGSMETIGADEWAFILKPSPLLRVRDVFERLGISPGSYQPVLGECGLPGPDTRLCHHWGFGDPSVRDRLYAAVCRCLPEFLAHRDRIAASLRGYLEAMEVFARPSLVVDAGWSGSSLRALRRMCPDGSVAPVGAYFGLFTDPAPGALEFFTGVGRRAEAQQLLKGSVALLEFLFGSPEPTVSRMEATGSGWTPVFRAPWSEAERQAWAGLESGIDRFVEAYLETFPHPLPGTGLPLLEALLRRELFHPDPRHLPAFSVLSHGEGWGTDHRLRLLPKPFLGAGRESWSEALCYAPWKAALLPWLASAAPDG